jgi:hypothetical protein
MGFTSRDEIPIFDWLKNLKRDFWSYRTYLLSGVAPAEIIESYFNIEKIAYSGRFSKKLFAREGFINRVDERLRYFHPFPPND